MLKNKHSLVKKIGITVFCIVFFFLFTSLWGFYNVVRPPKIISETNPEAMGLEYENIEFTTKDGINIRGWFVPRQMRFQPDTVESEYEDEAKTIIVMHGWPADKGNVLPVVMFLVEEYNLLLFDFRHLGESDGRFSTVGARETKDLKAAIEYLKTREINEVGIWGFSLGGAVALMTAPEKDEIKAVYSEGSFAKLDMLTSELFRIPLLNKPLGELTTLWGKLFFNINPKEISPVESIKELDIPIFISHSKNDEVISFEHALLLQESAKDKENATFLFKEDALHGQFDQELNDEITTFFKESL